MAVEVPVLREVVERACTRKDVLDACKRRDLGAVITALGTQGVTQGQLSMLTGIPQGRLSEYKNGKRTPTATSTFEAFANGLGMPPAARRALGLDPAAAGPELPGPGENRPAGLAVARQADMRPVLGNLSAGSAMPVLLALRGIHQGYVEADRLMGSMCITGPVQFQMPVVERACEVTRGADRAEMLRFACRFMEFGGWLFQDAGDLVCAMHWTDRALDYALELGDPRNFAYTLTRKAMIATESGNSAQGVGIANSALEYKDALTPRLRAASLRQRSYSNAVLGEILASARDSDEAITEAVAGERQGEEDRAPYCTPAYVVHPGLRGHGDRGILGPARARTDGAADPGEEPLAVARPLPGPRLRDVRVAAGGCLCRGWRGGAGVRSGGRGHGTGPGTWLAPRGWPGRDRLPYAGQVAAGPGRG
jgi:transcriptional regulator with XRE-family HTH domain